MPSGSITPQAKRAQGLPLRLRPLGAERHGPATGADRGAQGDTCEHPSQGQARRTPKRTPRARLRLTVFQHACKMGLEGIVSKRLGSRYRSGRTPDWLKFKNPEAPCGEVGGGGGLGQKRASVGPAVTGFPPHVTQSREKGFECGQLFLVGDFYCFAHHAA